MQKFLNKCSKTSLQRTFVLILYLRTIVLEVNGMKKKGKKYHIKNRIRFITFITVMMLIVSFSLATVFELADAHSEESPEYVSVYVKSGDTLWDLAQTYGSGNKDIRELIYDICSINNIKASDLRAGQTILIPVN